MFNVQELSVIKADSGETLGEAVRRMRKQRGYTQITLGKLAGLSNQSISEIELGINTPLETIAHLADVMGFNMCITFEEKEQV
jgi:transcriptional regulator with XRE-family HTH domain